MTKQTSKIAVLVENCTSDSTVGRAATTGTGSADGRHRPRPNLEGRRKSDVPTSEIKKTSFSRRIPRTDVQPPYLTSNCKLAKKTPEGSPTLLLGHTIIASSSHSPTTCTRQREMVRSTLFRRMFFWRPTSSNDRDSFSNFFIFRFPDSKVVESLTYPDPSLNNISA